MDFEWDTAKERANRKKHGIDFRTAAKVFLDPYVIEFDDHGATRPERSGSTPSGWSTAACSLSPTRCGATSSASYPPEERSRMKKGNITKFKLDPKKPPKSDWRAFDAMSAAERHRAAASGPRCPAGQQGAAWRGRAVCRP